MAETIAPISVDEYLQTDYDDGDREYVDGVVVERNLGEKSHTRVQRAFIELFFLMRAKLETWAFPEQRVQVKSTRFRVPDICVYLGGEPEEEVFHAPPFIVIEILSPRDTFTNIQEKLQDYAEFGVEFVWIVDPRTKTAMIQSGGAMRPVTDGVLRTTNPAIEIPFSELF